MKIVRTGETGRNLNTRLTEQKRATRNSDVNNRISEHHRLTNHKIDWDSAECLTYSTNYFEIEISGFIKLKIAKGKKTSYLDIDVTMNTIKHHLNSRIELGNNDFRNQHTQTSK